MLFVRASFCNNHYLFGSTLLLPKFLNNTTNMKKLAILLVAGAVAGLTSCGSNENNSSKEQIDSMATVRTDTMAAALKAQNDSLINAMAKMRADSALRADSISKAMSMMPKTGGHTTTAKTTTHTTTQKPKTETQKVNDLFNKNKTDAQKTKEAKQEEKKVNDLFK
jgi:hypothetical protein